MIRNSRPKFVPLTPNKLNKKKVLSYYGGKFPVCNGKKYRYPKPEEEEKWMKLISSALTYRNKMFYNHRHGLKPVKRKSKYEYLLYHCRFSLFLLQLGFDKTYSVNSRDQKCIA